MSHDPRTCDDPDFVSNDDTREKMHPQRVEVVPSQYAKPHPLVGPVELAYDAKPICVVTAQGGK